MNDNTPPLFALEPYTVVPIPAGGDEWRTPSDLYGFFRGWDDPALPGSSDGLAREWGDPTYCNPPYSDPERWIDKAIDEARKGKRIALLLKHDSSTRWWAKLHEAGAYFFAALGRLHYSDRGGADFPSVLVILPVRGRSE